MDSNWGKIIICLVIGWLPVSQSQAQSDTVLLQEVVISASSPDKYLPGGKTKAFQTDSTALDNLAQSIEDQAPVYFVQYGAPGQLSSINLRGLGANRTSLQWQGMEINSFTLGQTDFSEISTGSGDEIKIHYGGVGAAFGNGALGGTIQIGNQPKFDQGHYAGINIGIGSFGYWANTVNYSFSSKELSSSTKVFGRTSQNDFKYEIPDSVVRQQNAEFLHYGFTQDLTYSLNRSHQLSLHLWYNNHHREVQPNKHDFSGDEEVQTENTRVALSWQWSANKLFGKLNGGFTDDLQIFNESERTRLRRWFGSYEMEWKESDKLLLRVGGNLNYLLPKVDSYEESPKETRSELYTSGILNPIKKLSIGLSLRTPMSNGVIKTVSPLFSSEYQLVTSKKLELSIDVQAGNSYRLPTLNDLYWNPGGNPELKAETSMNLETGVNMSLKLNRLVFQTDLRFFRHNVDHWIIWIPGGREENPNGEVTSFWYPDNIREVLARGVEYQQTIGWKIHKNGLRSSLDISGTYNRAENKNALSPVDRSQNKQLPYTPLHIINGKWNLYYHTWHMGILSQYRSERFVETNNELPPLPSYTLWRFVIGKRGTWGKLNWGLQFQLNNAFNEVYETFENRAMPGRNYQVKLIITN